MKTLLLFSVFMFCFLTNLNAQSIFPPQLKTFEAQLHVHGLSNHNGAPQPASMQWHSFFADTTNTAILWWTDHREVFLQNNTSKFTFKNGVYNAADFSITGLTGNQVQPNRWDGFNNGGAPSVILNNTAITIKMTGDSIATYRYIYFSPRCENGLLGGSRAFVRPVISHPKITFDLNPNGIGTIVNGHVQLIILMGYHYYNGIAKQQSITYNFVSNTLPFSRTVVDSSTLTVNVPVANKVLNHVVLDLFADAAFLKDGVDNTTNDFKLLVDAKQNKFVSAKFVNIQIKSDDSVAYSQYLIHKGLASAYGNRYGINEYIGCEWSGDSHLNGFLPDSTVNRQALYDDASKNLGPQYFSDKVHAGGGVVSFNHPFGASGTAQTIEVQNYRTDTTAQYLLNNHCYGANILEVGYMNRGGADIDHHLKLWDILTANQLYMYGDGVNDSHGGMWTSFGNNATSWIWATDSTPAKLIDGLKTGKFFFGNNLKYAAGKFFLKVGNALMGDRVAPTSRNARVQVEITNLPANSEFRLTQGVIHPGLVVNYLYKDFVFDPANPPCVSLTSPCFIRVAVYSEGKPLLFSNPVVFISGASPNAPSICDTTDH